jgi:NTP pyrophosphatase (non-canonical NTP hydrolase)
MKMDKLLDFVKVESKRLEENYPCDNLDKETFARAVKMVEEMGELFDEILNHSSLQRKEKSGLDDNLAEEFADVLITTLLLAERMGVDIEKSLKKKIEKINKRYE